MLKNIQYHIIIMFRVGFRQLVNDYHYQYSRQIFIGNLQGAIEFVDGFNILSLCCSVIIDNFKKSYKIQSLIIISIL